MKIDNANEKILTRSDAVSWTRVALGFLAAFVAAQIAGIVVGLVTMDETQRAMGDLLRDDPWFTGFILATAILAFLVTYLQVKRPSVTYTEAVITGFIVAFSVWFPDRLIFAAAFDFPSEVFRDMFWTGLLRTSMGVAASVVLRYVWGFQPSNK